MAALEDGSLRGVTLDSGIIEVSTSFGELVGGCAACFVWAALLRCSSPSAELA